MAKVTGEVSYKSSITGSRFKRRRKPKVVMELNMTSLMDVMTILLIFLLKNFSTEPEIMISKDIKLPYTTSDERVKLAVNISISPDWILVDGKPVIKMQEATDGNYTVIPDLRKELLKKAEYQKRLATEGKEFKGNVLLQSDRSIPFKLIKKIMYTCGSTEYNNISLTLIKDPMPHY